MKTIIQICDRCKKEQRGATDYFTIYLGSIKEPKDLCEECVTSFKFWFGSSEMPDCTMGNQGMKYSDIQAFPIENLGLSVRAYNILRQHNIQYVGDMIDMTKEEMLKIRNMGLKSFEEIESALKTVLGLDIKEE